MTKDIERGLARLYALDRDLVTDPFPLYAAMRSESPVVRVGSVVAVARYDDIKGVLKDPVTFSSRRSTGSRVTDKRASLQGEQRARYDYLIERDLTHPGQQDGAGHTRLRRFVNEAFSASTVNATRAAMTDLAGELLDELDARREEVFDLSEFSYRLPFLWMCRMLGIPDVEAGTFRRRAYQVRLGLGTNYENLDAAFEAMKEVERWVMSFIGDRRTKPDGRGDDLISKLLTAEVGGTRLTDDELVTLFTVMLTTGNTNDMILNAVIELDRHHDQRDLLLADPGLIRGAAEEFLRYAPAVHSIHRVAAADCRIAGFPVRRGETIRLVVASGNRDDAVFDDPDVLDVRRRNARRHLDLGYGIHTCLGQWLTRLEIEVALTCLYERHPDLRVAAPFTVRRNYQFHGPESLLVTGARRPGGAGW